MFLVGRWPCTFACRRHCEMLVVMTDVRTHGRMLATRFARMTSRLEFMFTNFDDHLLIIEEFELDPSPVVLFL
jgi:hypothetical protein